jgi:hypothetical protein
MVFVAANVIVSVQRCPEWLIAITAIVTVVGIILYIRFVYAKDLYE